MLKFGREGLLDLNSPYYLKTGQGLQVPRRHSTHLPQLSFWVKLQEELGHVDHAGGLVGHHQAAGADRSRRAARLS